MSSINNFSKLVASVLGVAIVIWLALVLIGSMATSGLYWPWDWNSKHHGYPHQVSNITYAQASGAPAAHNVAVRGLSKSTTSTLAPPQCVVGGHDLFNPSGVATPALEKGVTISWRTHNGIQNVTLPSTRIAHQVYTGKRLEVRFHYNLVPLYYDNFYDSVWVNSPAGGPKGDIIACMQGLTPSQRAEVGILTAKVMVPAGMSLPAALR